MATKRKCFFCDGSGHKCNRCGESDSVCHCESEGETPDLGDCPECEGTGIASADLPPKKARKAKGE